MFLKCILIFISSMSISFSQSRIFIDNNEFHEAIYKAFTKSKKIDFFVSQDFDHTAEIEVYYEDEICRLNMKIDAIDESSDLDSSFRNEPLVFNLARSSRSLKKCKKHVFKFTKKKLRKFN